MEGYQKQGGDAMSRLTEQNAVACPPGSFISKAITGGREERGNSRKGK